MLGLYHNGASGVHSRFDTSKNKMAPRSQGASRQEQSIAAHIQRIRAGATGVSNKKTTTTKKSSALVKKVSFVCEFDGYSVTNDQQAQITATFEQSCDLTRRTPLLTYDLPTDRNETFIDERTASCTEIVPYNSVRARSTPVSRSDSRSSELSGTDYTSSCRCHSPEISVAGLNNLQAAFQRLDQTLTAVEDHNRVLTMQLTDNNARHQELQQKYKDQLQCRRDDYAKVILYSKQYEEALAHSESLKSDNAAFQSQIVELKEQAQAELRAKDERLAEVLRCTISEMQVTHKQDMFRKDVEHNTALSMANAKHKGSTEALSKAVRERNEARSRIGVEQRHFAKAIIANRKAREEEKIVLEEKTKQQHLDYRDVLQAQKDEIQRLTKEKLRVQRESTLLFDILRGRLIDGGINDVLEESRFSRLENSKLRKRNRRLEQKLEEVMQALQTQYDHFNKHAKSDQDAQALVYDQQREISGLRDRIFQQQQAISKFSETSEPTKQGLSSSEEVSFGLLTYGEFFSNLIGDNDDLRAEVNALKKGGETQQIELARLEGENLAVAMQAEVVENDLHKAQEEIRTMQNVQEVSEKELDLLRLAVDQHGELRVEDKIKLHEHLRSLTLRNVSLTEKSTVQNKGNKALREELKVIVDSKDSEIRKEKALVEYWYTRYFDDTVNNIERLLEENRALKIALGRHDIFPEQRVHHTSAAERAFLREGCKWGLHGVDTSKIPREVWEQDFHQGWIPATHEALRALRLLGWHVMYETSKCYLTPVFRAFTE